ncbi:MAG: MSHA biogenesis protein MshI [Pseudomonadota bacterium]
MSQQINLFNPIFLKQKKIFATTAMAPALLLLLVGMMAMGYYASVRVAAMQKTVASSKEQLAKLQARQEAANASFHPRARSHELELKVAAAQADLNALKRVGSVLQRGDFGNTRGYSEYFKALARQHVGGLWLTGVSIVGAGNEIGVQGRAMQADLVPNFIGRLNQEAVMRGKAFDSLKIDQAMQKVKKAGAPEVSEPASYVEFDLQSIVADKAGVPQS